MDVPFLHAGTVVSRRRLLVLSGAAASALLAIPKLADAAMTAPDDPRMQADSITIENGAGGLRCYRARPDEAADAVAGVVVAHDALGLTPHFQDVARRLALEGFSVLAPDFASRYGGTPSEPEPAREVVDMTTWDEWLADAQAAFAWLAGQSRSNGKVAAVGFGLGGSALCRIVLRTNELTSAVIFYGRVPPLENLPRTETQLLLNYAADDPLVDPQVPDFEKALERAGARCRTFTYAGTRHGFEDDSAPAAYSADAAKLAWSRTIDFLHATLA